LFAYHPLLSITLFCLYCSPHHRDIHSFPTRRSSDLDEEETNNTDGETISAEATAYTASCDGCSGTTATGVDLNENSDEKVIAVDPDVIPLGSKVHVEGYGTATAADTGGDINGD